MECRTGNKDGYGEQEREDQIKNQALQNRNLKL
jgi:hypothetical protein